MLLKVGMVLAAVPMSMLALVAGTGVVVVEVQEKKADGHHFAIPVPLLLAEGATAFVPEQDRRVHIGGDAQRFLPVAAEMVGALEQSPDGELIRVEERDQNIRIAKVGSNLEIHVTERGRGEEVSVVVPLAMAAEVLRAAHDGTLEAPAIVSALRRARLTTLAVVDNPNEHVRITVF